MSIKCPHCAFEPQYPSGPGQPSIRRYGRFTRACDHIVVSRWKCGQCRRTFSGATEDPWFKSRTRRLNQSVYVALSSTNSMRRTARTLRTSRGTIARKLMVLGRLCEERVDHDNRRRPAVDHCQFDDLETHEHTKLKPLSVTLAVTRERLVLAIEVSQMPANGLLAKKSVQKYGKRSDKRGEGRQNLFKKLLPIVSATATFRSDENPHYPPDLKAFFPHAQHFTTKGRRARSHGQGELKVGGSDPIFALNHTCAMLRANINRLVRKTWCTTKRADRLRLHLYVQADYHNQWICMKRPPQLPRRKRSGNRGSAAKSRGNS